MRYKTFACMNVALIGDGGIVEAMARKLARSPYNIFIGTKSQYPMLSDNLLKDYEEIKVTTIEDAAASADVIILATPPDNIREAAYLLDDVREKVIIDMSGLYFTRFGNYFNTAASINNITHSPFVVKCYSSDGFKSLLNLLERKNVSTMFFAGESKKAKEMLKLISKDLGFDSFHDYGNAEDIPALDTIALTGEFLVPVQSA